MLNATEMATAVQTSEAVIQQQEIDPAVKNVKRKEFEEMDKRISQSRSALFNEGISAGFNAAADDYSTDRINLDLFSRDKTQEDMTDHYALGFELGYLRKLAEICVL